MSFLGRLLRRQVRAIAPPVNQNAPLILSGQQCDCGERQLYTCERERCLFCMWSEGRASTSKAWDDYIQMIANRREKASGI